MGIEILFLLFVLLGGLFLLASRQPDEFRVSRSTFIAAPPERIFPYLNDLRRGAEWTPWGTMDPDMKLAYSGPSEGVGANCRWSGNRKVGRGSQTILESEPDRRVLSRLDFEAPMKATNHAELLLAPEDGGTRLTWSMFGPNRFAGKLMSLFMNCERMVGAQFEQGLDALRRRVEAA